MVGSGFWGAVHIVAYTIVPSIARAGTLASAPLADQSTEIGIRTALSGVVLFVALVAGSWLARQASHEPEQIEPGAEHERTGRLWLRIPRHVPRRERYSPWVRRVTLACIWVAAAAAIALIWLYNQAIPGETSHQFGLDLRDFIIRVGASLIALAVALSLGRILQRAFHRNLRARRISANLVLLGGRAIFTCTLIVGLVVILDIWGTGLVLPVTLLGALTVALSLALQDIIRNLVAGIYLLIEHPFVINDRIAAASYVGEVEDIQIRVTVLRTADNQKVLIPNALLFTTAVVNLSAYERRRVGLTLAVPNSAPDDGADGMEGIEGRIRAALRAVPGVLNAPEPRVGVYRATAGKLELRVDFWMSNAEDPRDGHIVSDVIEQLRARLRDAEVSPLEPTATTP